MGMQDRDWYREKEIDWEHGGLRGRKGKRRRLPRYLRWVLAAVLLVVGFVLFRQV